MMGGGRGETIIYFEEAPSLKSLFFLSLKGR